MKSPKFTAETRAKSAQSAADAKDPAVLAESMDLPQTGEARRRVIARLTDMPVSCRRTYCRAMTGKSLRAAVTAHCRECMGWVRAEVPHCTSPECPLYPYRPGV